MRRPSSRCSDGVDARFRAARNSSSVRHNLTRSASPNACHSRGAGSTSSGHNDGRRLRSMLHQRADAARAPHAGAASPPRCRRRSGCWSRRGRRPRRRMRAASKSSVGEQQVRRRRPVETEAAFAVARRARRRRARSSPLPCAARAAMSTPASRSCARSKSPNMSAPSMPMKRACTAEPSHRDRDVGRRAAGVLRRSGAACRASPTAAPGNRSALHRSRRSRDALCSRQAPAGTGATLRDMRARPAEAVQHDVAVAQQRQHERMLHADAVGEQRPAAAARPRRRRSP